MSNENTDQDYTIRVRPRGGAGRNALWQWEVYASGNALPIEKGVCQGVEGKAYGAAEAALARQRARRAGTTTGV